MRLLELHEARYHRNVHPFIRALTKGDCQVLERYRRTQENEEGDQGRIYVSYLNDDETELIHNHSESEAFVKDIIGVLGPPNKHRSGSANYDKMEWKINVCGYEHLSLTWVDNYWTERWIDIMLD